MYQLVEGSSLAQSRCGSFLFPLKVQLLALRAVQVGGIFKEKCVRGLEFTVNANEEQLYGNHEIRRMTYRSA
jgi:hypothetical protein